MLLPKRVKHRKQHRGRMTGRAMRGNRIAHGDFGLVALEPAWITNRQIEAARIAMTRYIKRGGQVWIQIFPDKPITIMNAGIGGESAWDMKDRLDYDVFNRKPTYVTLTFGMNDTGYDIYMKPCESYLLFYTVDEAVKTVTVLRVMQDGMDWQYIINRWLRENA